MSSRFSGKTKADLIAIARISGLLKTTVSQKMRKNELLEFLENAEKNHQLGKISVSGRDEGTTKVAERFSSIEEPAIFEMETTVQGSETPLPHTDRGEEQRFSPGRAVAEVKTSGEKRSRKTADAKRTAEEKNAPVGKNVAAENKEAAAKTAPGDKKSKMLRSKNKGGRKDSPRDKDDETPRQEGERHEFEISRNGSADGMTRDEKRELRQERERRQNRRLQKKQEEPPVEAEENGEETEDLPRGKVPHEPEIGGGVLEIMPEGYGFLRTENYIQHPNDFYLPAQYIRRFNLRNGDYVVGPYRQQRENDRYRALYYVKEVNGLPPDKMCRRPSFERLTPIYPNQRFVLETLRTELSTRIIDLIAPIGKGQRGMIVSPPKAGKTILLQKIANAISQNNPTAKLIVLLIDERPEEVTDMQRSIQGEVVYSTFDKTPENHVKITELVLERAMRMVELGEDVVILLDSITRMGRAYNLTINPTGRTLSGGLDPGALYGPKRFFGAARNIENGGSLTIIATALVETGSRMDEVIFEEFKGTGNMEVVLDRKLSEKRIFPAIDINRSGTRREELLLEKNELDCVWGIRKAFSQLDTAAVTETIISLLLKTRSNEQFIQSINVSFNDKSLYEAMRGSLPNTQKQQSNGGNSQS